MDSDDDLDGSEHGYVSGEEGTIWGEDVQYGSGDEGTLWEGPYRARDVEESAETQAQHGQWQHSDDTPTAAHWHNHAADRTPRQRISAPTEGANGEEERAWWMRF